MSNTLNQTELLECHGQDEERQEKEIEVDLESVPISEDRNSN